MEGYQRRSMTYSGKALVAGTSTRRVQSAKDQRIWDAIMDAIRLSKRGRRSIRFLYHFLTRPRHLSKARDKAWLPISDIYLTYDGLRKPLFETSFLLLCAVNADCVEDGHNLRFVFAPCHGVHPNEEEVDP
ncbi:hypothetical protein Tco_0725172 [Tanacetum coccineum]|uniref:Uncharacterized protein n=1 Tax=Tanacetum coccineum TaxID=301880 RepID=A0ABQ4YD59_9ASTR